MLTAAVAILLYTPAEPRGYNLEDSVYYIPDHNKWIFMMLFGVITLIAPLLSVLTLRWNRMISSLEVTDARERPIPYFVILVYFCIGYFFLMRSPQGAVPIVFKCLLLSSIIYVCILLLVSRRFKISGHVSGIAGVTGVLIAYHIKNAALPLLLLLGLILLIGILGTARIGLQQHKPSEVYVGALLSGAIGFLTYYFEFAI